MVTLGHMSEIRQSGDLDPVAPIAIPPLTLGWRMQMAMDHGGRSVEYMAIKCGVSRSTISRWINDGGKRPPRRGDLEIWARECRVPIDWLMPDQVGHSRQNIAAKLRTIQGGGHKSWAPTPALASVPTV